MPTKAELLALDALVGLTVARVEARNPELHQLLASRLAGPRKSSVLTAFVCVSGAPTTRTPRPRKTP
jgi:hypothetical protein